MGSHVTGHLLRAGHQVLEAARRSGCGRVVLASTVWVYGAAAGIGERTEQALADLRQAGHVYVSTKLAAELLVHSYREMYGQRFTILRYGIPYGPRMREELVGPVPVGQLPPHAADYQGVSVSNSLAKELLDWSPETSFGAGLRRYLDWLKEAR